MLLSTLPSGSGTMSASPLVSGVVQRSEEDAVSRMKVDAPGGYHGAGFIGMRVHCSIHTLSSPYHAVGLPHDLHTCVVRLSQMTGMSCRDIMVRRAAVLISGGMFVS